MQKLGPEQRKWVETLKSGKYKQGEGYLRKNDKYCCLGVYADLCGVDWISNCGIYFFREGFFETEGFLSDELVDRLGLNSNDGEFNINFVNFDEINYTSLAEMNDGGKTFQEIADFIEKNPELVFDKVV